MMVIIIEGPDGAGKTTLMQHPYFHECVQRKHGVYPNASTSDLMRIYLRDVLDSRNDKTTTFVADRSWLSEYCYGPVIRGHARLTLAHGRMIERALLGVNAVVIACLPSPAWCENVWRQRLGTEYVKHEEDYRKIYELYSSVGLPRFVPWISYSHESTGYDQLFDLVNDLTMLQQLGPGTGYFKKGNILLVGDSANLENGGFKRFPFISTQDSGCSYWLADQLDQANINERALYWVNANEVVPKTKGQPENWLLRLKPRGVIALGNVARGWCERLPIHFTHVPHPQYWKRFRTHEPYPLLEALHELGV